jgi:hypothetical protein
VNANSMPVRLNVGLPYFPQGVSSRYRLQYSGTTPLADCNRKKNQVALCSGGTHSLTLYTVSAERLPLP